jgi:hypothetical protein
MQMKPETPESQQRRGAARLARLFAGLMLVLQAACSGAAAASDLGPPTGTLAHGPFEIVVAARRMTQGSWVSGNSTSIKVSEFEVRWRGKTVATAGGAKRFWRVLRLQGAPRPALLLIGQGFVLASDDATGQLQLTPVDAQSNGLAEVQWLDSEKGQPGASQTFGAEAITDLQADTQLAGGRWLRFGARNVMDVTTLKQFPVAPWVPIVPGVPITSIDRDGDEARAFSPGRTLYVLAARGIDFSRADQADAYGLLVVDIARGTATELRVDRKRFRFSALDEIDPTWVNHHFSWQRDGAGRERLVPRERFAPWPWRAKLTKTNVGGWQLYVHRIDAAFMPVLRRLVEREPGARIDTASAKAPAKTSDRLRFSLGNCALHAVASGEGSPFGADYDIGILQTSDPVSGPNAAVCEAALQRLAMLIDAELATGRHDALLKHD